MLLLLQLSRLHALEGHHDEVKQELERNIEVLQAQIAKCDADYLRNMEVLNAVSENLMNLLRNVRESLLTTTVFITTVFVLTSIVLGIAIYASLNIKSKR